MGLGKSVCANIPMHIEVGDHPAFDKLSLHKIACQLYALLLVQLARNGEFNFAGELCVLAQFSRFDFVPQGRAVAQSFGRAVGQHHLGMSDARLVGKVMRAIQPLIVQPSR
jgi:hypothetical protein